MSCDSRLFMKDGIGELSLIKYIDKKYGLTNIDHMNSYFYTLWFDDGEDHRMLSVYTYLGDEDEDKPLKIIPNKTCILSLGLWGNSIEILKDIAKNFSGGYMQDNDCGFENGSDEWYFVEGKTINNVTERENKIFQLVENNLTDDKIDKIRLTRFIIDNIDKIKEI